MKKYDVAVVGGGFAGVAAALSAAREGSKVILIEKSKITPSKSCTHQTPL